MAQDRAISGHTSLAGAGLAAGDLFEVVDVSDATDAATGTNKKMLASEKAAALWALAGDAGNVLVVDAVNGSDSAGARGKLSKPFLTPAAAQAAAVSGDTIIVYPGSYTAAASLAKNGVNWHFASGATVTATSTESANVQVFSDGGTAMTFVVTGRGTFIGAGTAAPTSANVIEVSHASSDVRIECQRISQQTVPGEQASTPNAVSQSGGTLWIAADQIDFTDPATYGLWWINGDMRVRVRRITTTLGSACVQAVVTATPTGDCYVDADQIDGLVGVHNGSTQAEAKLWVVASLLACTGQAVGGTGGKTYVTCQKMSGCTTAGQVANGVVNNAGGAVWVNALKITGTYGTAVLNSSGTARVVCPHLEDLGHLSQAVKVAGGSLELTDAAAVVAIGDGVLHAGGAARLTGCRLDTSAAGATKRPAVVSGAGLALDRCTLVANAGADSVYAGSAQTVKNYGSVANTAKNANVTVQVQALVVDANVS